MLMSALGGKQTLAKLLRTESFPRCFATSRVRSPQVNVSVPAAGTHCFLVRFILMKLIDPDEYRAQAKHCRELAMSTKDAEIEQLFLQTAEDLEGQADRLETSDMR